LAVYDSHSDRHDLPTHGRVGTTKESLRAGD
jgi:hypothetical protein